MPSLAMRLPAALRQVPPLPEALVTALELIRDRRSQRADLARVLSLDQGLTGLFLHTVNSAYYGLPRRITSLDEAIGYLGYDTVESTILAISASRVLSRPVAAYMLERGLLWQHSVAVAFGAQRIARDRGITPLSDAYVAGLLHDVGKLVLDLLVEHKSQWAGGVDRALEARTWTEVERLVTGHDHAEVGAVLVRSWNLPDRVVEAVACHHTPGGAELAPELASAVHLANAAALMAGIGLGVDGLNSRLEEEAVERLHWSEREMESLIGEMQSSVSAAKEMLSVR